MAREWRSDGRGKIRGLKYYYTWVESMSLVANILESQLEIQKLKLSEKRNNKR